MFSWKVNHYLYFLSEENEVRRDALDSEIELKQQIQPFINVVTYTTIIRTWETCLKPNGHKRTRNPWTGGHLLVRSFLSVLNSLWSWFGSVRKFQNLDRLWSLDPWVKKRPFAGKYFKIFIIFQVWFLLFLEHVAIWMSLIKEQYQKNIGFECIHVIKFT